MPVGLLLVAADVAGRGAGAAQHAAHPTASLARGLRRVVLLGAGAGGASGGEAKDDHAPTLAAAADRAAPIVERLGLHRAHRRKVRVTLGRKVRVTLGQHPRDLTGLGLHLVNTPVT